MWQFQSDANSKASSGSAGSPEASQRPSRAVWSDDASTWTAHFRDGSPRLTIRFRDQSLGETEPELLGWLPQAEIGRLETEDVYVRGDDLIASYSAATSPLRQQIYWRHLRGVHGVEMIFSLQNQELQGAPVAHVRSQLPATQVWLSNRLGQFEHLRPDGAQRLPISGGWVAVPLPRDRVYLEHLHPTDFRNGSVGVRDGLLEINWELFGEPIEKGVIRRARARAEWVSQAEFSPQLLAQRREQFACSPIPLTT